MSDHDSSNSTRRDFLKTSAALAAGAAMASQFVDVRAAFAAGDDTIKIALVGCGGRGSGACKQALTTQTTLNKGKVKLIAVADAFEDNAKGALGRLKAELPDQVDVAPDHIFSGFDAYQKALDAGPDLVILATPPGFRPMHFEAAVKAGKNIFMEKPVSTDAAGIRKVLAAAEEAKKKNLKVGVGLQRHHDPKYKDIIQRVQEGAIGDLILCRAYWNDAGVWVRGRETLAANKKKDGKGPLSEMEYQMRNWYYFNWLCGDHINEQHIHNLDVINWLMKGPPATAKGMGGRQVRTGIDNGEIYDHHAVEFTYPDGTTLMSECRHQPGTWKSVTEHAHGSKGYADLSAGRITFKDGQDWRFKGDKVDPYQVEHDDLFTAIREDKPYNEAERGAYSTMTSILGRMATYSGVEVKMEDALKAQVTIMPEQFAWDAKPPTTPDKDGRYPIPMPGVAGDAELWERVNKEIMGWQGGGGGKPTAAKGRAKKA